MRMGTAWPWTCALACALVVAACNGSGDADQLESGAGAVAGGSSTTTSASAGAGSGLYDDAQALAWLGRECSSCHGVDATTGKQAQYYSAWPMPQEGLTRSFLEVSELTAVAYQTIRNAALEPRGTAPSPMPPQQASAERRDELRAMLEWFQRSIPFAVIDADARYGNDSPATEATLVQFSCKQPLTLRTFLGRFTFGAFDRAPTTSELGAFSAEELSAPVTPAQREAIVARLDREWREEFLQIGLKKLATAIGGAPGIKPANEVGTDVVADLKDELYQSFLARYDTAEYADYFNSNTVMVSPNTAPLYGCEVDTGWKECALTAPRGGFFTTLGFLNSKPSSFMIENNNYGRVAALYFTLYGEQLLAATGGPTGDGIPELPSCLEATDTRRFNGAPRGSAAVPESGKVCQSCHVSRHMAAGSILFRPFSITGQVYSADTFGTNDGPDKAVFDGATLPTWTFGPVDAPTQVDGAFLTSLLTATPQSCIATGRPANPYVAVTSIADLADQLMTNMSSFSRGVMRHAQRAFSNLTPITLEMGLASLKAFDEGRRRLPDLVKVYFGSDSFACAGDP
jgi:hypothetical protein